MNDAMLTLTPPTYPELEREVYRALESECDRVTEAPPLSAELLVRSMFSEEACA